MPTDSLTPDGLCAGDRIAVTPDDRDHSVMTFVGWTTDAVGNPMLRFHRNGMAMPLYPPAFANAVAKGTYSSA